jgi:hypothetical protein
MDDDDGRDLPVITCSGGIRLPPLGARVPAPAKDGAE